MGCTVVVAALTSGPGDAAMRQAASYAGDSDQVAMASVGATPQRAFRTAMMTGSQPPAAQFLTYMQLILAKDRKTHTQTHNKCSVPDRY